MSVRRLDYDDVRVNVRDVMVKLERPAFTPADLTFEFGSLTSRLPFLVYHQTHDGESDQRVLDACARAGALTVGPRGTDVPLHFLDRTNVRVDVVPHRAYSSPGCVLVENFDPLSEDSLGDLRIEKSEERTVLLGCVTSVAQAESARQLKLMDAMLIGPILAETALSVDSVGMRVDRISLLQQVAFWDEPAVATVASSMDACKAFVAGASGVLINVGGPFESQDDVATGVNAILVSLEKHLRSLCALVGAKNLIELRTNCELTSVRG